MASFGLDPKSLNNASCKIFWYLLYLLCATSSWIETFIAFERCISIAFVNRFQVLTKRAFQYAMIFSLLVYNLALYSSIPYFFQTGSNDTTNGSSSDLVVGVCEPSDSYYYFILSWADLLNSTIVPFMIMISCSITTIRCLVRSRKRAAIASSHNTSALASTSRMAGNPSVSAELAISRH